VFALGKAAKKSINWRSVNLKARNGQSPFSRDCVKIVSLFFFAACVGSSNSSAQNCGVHFSPEPGYYETAQTVTITSEYPEAVLRFTVDGTVPDDASPAVSGPINVDNFALIQVRSWDASDPTGSCISRGGYWIQTTPASFDPTGNTTATNGMHVEIRAATEGTIIKYQIEADPTSGLIPNDWLDYTGAISLTAPFSTSLPSALVRVFALTTKSNLSDGYAYADYYFPTVGAPGFDPVPSAGFEVEPVLVSISRSSDGEELFVTVDGSIPTTNSARYSDPFLVLPGTLISTLGVKDGLISRVSQILYPSKCNYYSDLAKVNSEYQNAANYACVAPWMIPFPTVPEIPNFSVNARVEKNMTVVRWNAVAWANYQVQRSSDLQSWENLGSSQSGLNLTLGASDPLVVGQNLFYRVVATAKE
jgi:hypothetical protein